MPCKEKKLKKAVQSLKYYGILSIFEAWFVSWVFGKGRKMKGENSSEKRVEAKKADLMDWLLAIDASLS